MRRFSIALLVSALPLAGCDSSTPSTPTKTPAAPSKSATFEGTLKVSGSAFYSFTTSQYGTINVTFNSLKVDGDDSALMMAVGLGQPSGVDCLVSTTQTTATGTTPQITGPYEAGVYCVRISDPAPLPSPAKFNITIAYP